MIKGISFTYMIYMANETFLCHSRSPLGNSAHVFTSAFMVFVLLFSSAAIQDLHQYVLCMQDVHLGYGKFGSMLFSTYFILFLVLGHQIMSCMRCQSTL